MADRDLPHQPSWLEAVPASQRLADAPLAFAVAEPSTGAILVAPRRRVASWFDLSPEEHAAAFVLAAAMRARLLAASPSASGVRIEIDAPIASASGEVHAHLRIAARSPARPSRPPALWTPTDHHFLIELLRRMGDRAYDRIDLVVSFVMRSGIDAVAQGVEEALQRGAQVRVLTTDYLNITDASALGWLLDRTGESLQVKVYTEGGRSFHPKAYLFRASDGIASPVAFVGSSNLSRSALAHGVEWNLGVHDMPTLASAFESLWRSQHARPLTREWLVEYSQRPRAFVGPSPFDPTEGDADEPGCRPTPNAVQVEALHALVATRGDGYRAALVVLATGLGKTWLAAFDSHRPEFARIAFIAHRGELLTQARDTFRRARPDARLSLFDGASKDLSGDIVFASVLSLRNALTSIARDAFDYVIVDEFHHADADSYRAVLAHLRPRFLLGLTATPVRMDGADIMALCDDNEIRVCGLVEGIARKLLSPFHYRGVRDLVDLDGVPFKGGRFAEKELTRAVTTDARAALAVDEWARTTARRGIGFCVSIEHADFMAKYFTKCGVASAAVHSGPTSAARGEALEQLRCGALAVLFAVDLFNEGLDVPQIEAVLMLRPTESPVVFLQQLGRGLRIAEGKPLLHVVDLVANHRSALLKVRVLADIVGGASGGSAHGSIARLKQPLPEGVTVDIGDVLDLLEQLAARESHDPLVAFFEEWREQYGARPSLLQVAMAGAYEKRATQGWAAWLHANGHRDDRERSLDDATCALLRAVERVDRLKAPSIVALEQFISLGGLVTPPSVDALCLRCRDAMLSDAHLRRILTRTNTFDDWMNPPDDEWIAWWKSVAIEPLTDSAGSAIVHVRAGVLSLSVPIGREHSTLVRGLLIEVLEYRRWRLVTSLLPVFRDDDGREIDAEFEARRADASFAVTLSARGGTRGTGDVRNAQYMAGFKLCLQRLAALSAVLTDAFVESDAARKRFTPDQRRIMPDGAHPIRLHAHPALETLRGELTRRARNVKDPGSKGGNDTRRVTLHVEIPRATSVEALVHRLVWGHDRPV